MAKIAINGFGRIGRLFFRQVFNNPAHAWLEIAAINDLTDPENLAYLLRHDTVYWGYGKNVTTGIENGAAYLVVEGRHIPITAEKDPANLPWGSLGIDVAVEATGFFESFAGAAGHIKAGAKRVVIASPAKEEDGAEGVTVLMGVNEGQMKSFPVTSNGSCTTNASSPVAFLMAETIGVKKAILSTVHGYTATQSLVDGNARSKDFRRGRAAALNIVPSTTGAAISVTRAVPSMKGKFDGIALRVPVVTGSIADFTFIAARPTTVAEVNAVFTKAAQDERWKGVLGVTAEPLVSSDIVGTPYGAIVDLAFTKVVDGDLVKILSWYDNEWGYVSTLVRHVERAAALL
jgi:glyceraldehyde 3-phosphate dehydrogenase